MKQTPILPTHSRIANKKRHPDFIFIKHCINSCQTIFQWECGYGMISLYSFKHKDREGVQDLISIATKKRKELFPDYFENELETELHKKVSA